jgi:hypothetical protein
MKTEDLRMIRCCEVDDWRRAHPLPTRPGARPACSDSAVLPFALARAVLGSDSERRVRRVRRADWRHLVPHLPAPSELNRRTRWLWGALELRRRHELAPLPPATEDWYAFDPPPLPVKHPSRVRGPDQWCLPGGLVARFGRCAAKARWCYGFRLAVLTSLIDPAPICWALVPAAVNERAVVRALLEDRTDLKVLADKGVRGKDVAQQVAGHAIVLLTPPTRKDRATLPALLQRLIAAHRHRIDGTFTTDKDQLHLEQQRARTGWGLLTRVAGTLAAFTLRAVWRRTGRQVE